MAVLVEGISVIVRCSSILRLHPAGADGFAAMVPNASMCADGELARVGFMTPDDARAFVTKLEKDGFTYLSKGESVDIAIADQHSGILRPCDWAEFGRTQWNGMPNCPIAICRARSSSVDRVVVPNGWRFENSLSASHRFVDLENVPASLTLIRREIGLDIYKDEGTGTFYYVGRA